MPKSEIPSLAIRLTPQGCSVDDLAARLRTGTPALVGYTEDNALHLNLRTVFPQQDTALTSAVLKAIEQ